MKEPYNRVELTILVFILSIIFTPISLFSQDTTCGIVWEPPIQLSPDSVNAGDPDIAIQRDTIHITWTDGGKLKYPYVRSVDGGKTFEPFREIAPDSVGYVSPNWISYSGKRLHAFFSATKTGGSPWFYYHMFSDDQGKEWSIPYKFTDSLIYYSCTGYSDTVIFRSSRPQRGEFYLLTISKDEGLTWATKSCPILNGNRPMLSLIRNTLHLVKGSGFDSSGFWSEFVIQYRKSTDLGETWSDSIPLSTVNGTTAYEPSLAAYDQGDSSKLFAAWKDTKYGALTMDGCSILGRFSNNNGNNFNSERRFDDRPAGLVPTVGIYGNKYAVAWMDDLNDGIIKISVSTNAGVDWCAPYLVSNGLYPKIGISKNALHVLWQGQLLNGDLGVFYRRGVFLTTLVNENRNLISEFHLEQNYPNPFNPKTVIKYKVQSTEYVSIKIYNVFGREITTLVNEKKSRGEYQVEWNAENVSSGVYYYRFTSGNYSAVGKAILLK